MKITHRALKNLAFSVLFFSGVSCQAAEPGLTLVEEGSPRAEIVITEDPPRLVGLAATELQDYLKKISGAEVPIVHARSGDYPIAIYVGQSAGTDELGITDEGLTHGAFRMASGDDWLVLLGRDSDFEPVEPWPRSNGDHERAQADWEELTGGSWKNPMRSSYKNLHKQSGIWTHDEGGSLQAVYALLRDLGVRWYMPGDHGEVVPEQATINLPAMDRTVKPDFAYRDLRLGNVPHFSWEDFIWHFRLGLNDNGLVGSHGMGQIHGGKAMQEAHPEYYALVNGERETSYRGTGHACFSSEGLLKEAIAYARWRFDHFDLPAVSIFPQDGYHHCQCELCAEQSPSELVWNFVEQVARELYKSHPDRIVMGGSYTPYNYPPESIEKFSPNVAVRISSMRPGLDDNKRWKEYWELVQDWKPRLAPGHLMRNANIHWTASSAFPIIHTRSIARELAAMHGLSLGEASSVPRKPEDRWENVGLSHLNIYVLSRYLWDSQQDLDVLLDEYYTQFYGPAAAEMRAAFEFAEEIYPREGRATPSRVPIADRVRFLELLLEARNKAGETIYGQRVQQIIDEMQPLEELREQNKMAEARGDVREFWSLQPMENKDEEAAESIQLDGKPDELFWTWHRPGGNLVDAETGETPKNGTFFQMRWYKDHLYVGIRCEIDPKRELNIPTTKNGDPAIFDGDYVALFLETQDHSFYEIAVNPAGAVYDADRSEDGVESTWTAKAEVATHVGEGAWTVEMRIPVVDQDVDPLHWVAGRVPSHIFPWYFNVARQSLNDEGIELTAWEPTGSETFRNPSSFGRIYLRPNARLRTQLTKDGVRN